MSSWKSEMTEDARKDFLSLDGHQKKIVTKAIEKVLQNPLPNTEGGFGIPLGNKHGYNLTGYCEIKLRGQNLRIIYKPEKNKMTMLSIVIDERSDLEAYRIAFGRIKNN